MGSGASLIAANISAEQFIGMSGSGFKLASVCRLNHGSCYTDYCGQVFTVMLQRRIYTIPQFLRERYNDGVVWHSQFSGFPVCIC